MMLKRLTTGNLNFNEMIGGKFLYADKTKYIYELLKAEDKQFFLSRPRRFGKSLLLDVIKTLFTSEKDHFKNYWIGGPESDYEFRRHEVISLDLSLETGSPESTMGAIVTQLEIVAARNGLDVKEDLPGPYLMSLVQALCRKPGSRVVVLIDEYDAPVTFNMDDPKLAEANAKVLGQFFATLKTRSISDYVRLTVVTGITRYALTSLDSEPNRFRDLSLDPAFAGICGFPVDEFDALFGDRLPVTLAALKEGGRLKPSATVEDLRKRILGMYDGYYWGGPTRILNPWDILNFFRNNSFDDYWIQSGRPGHLTPLIKAKPLAFLEQNLKTCRSGQLRRSELTGLEAVPVLFHSGYLTLDETAETAGDHPAPTAGEDPARPRFFRFPNVEVDRFYRRDFHDLLFGRKRLGELETMGRELKEAFAGRDAARVESLLGAPLAWFRHRLEPDDETTFLGLVDTILEAMGFRTLSGPPGPANRLDLAFGPSSGTRLVIELGHVRPEVRPTPEMKARMVANALISSAVPLDLVFEALAPLAAESFSPAVIEGLLNASPERAASPEARNRLLGEAALRSLPEDVTTPELVKAAERLLSPKQIKAALGSASKGTDPSDGEIDRVLSETAEKTLRDMAERGGADLAGDDAKEMVHLALAVFDRGRRLKAAFGPGWPKAEAERTP